MVSRSHPIDVSNSPELLRLAEEVEASHEPRLLRRGNRVLALVVPMSEANSHLRPTEEELPAFRSATGGQADIAMDDLLAVVHRTAGMLESGQIPSSIEEETEAFERAIAEENVLPDR